MLNVICLDGPSKDSKRVISGIINLMTEFLKKRGMDGTWELELYRKTGGGGQERVIFKRKIPGEKALLYQVRPHDRDSSWTVLVFPPSDDDAEKVLEDKIVTTEEEDVKEDEKKMESESNDDLCENHVHMAKVVSHQDHGFDVEIDVKGRKVSGFVSLADLGDYDKRSLNKYPVGKNIKILVCDTSVSPVVCSTRVEAVLSTTNSKDVFTGALNKDGSLPLKAFTKGHNRVYDLLQELTLVMMESKENFIERDKAIQVATDYLKAKYSAKSIDPRSVPSILSQLCHAVECIPMPVLSNCEKDGVRGYSLTEFAWGELGGMDSILSDGPKETEPEPEPELDAAESAIVVPEISDEPEVPEEIEECLEAASRIEDAAMYFGKLCRLNEISSQIDTLTAERDAIQKWIDENKGMRESLLEIQKQSSAISKDRIREGGLSQFLPKLKHGVSLAQHP